MTYIFHYAIDVNLVYHALRICFDCLLAFLSVSVFTLHLIQKCSNQVLFKCFILIDSDCELEIDVV